ncbi:hypothetical protein L226DRAFT_76274 [Lentinus tigrinus ALCF2SS1-7]|uniref:uncharacterized protein n=1 Tax=Lentinus tigrinus ALCF2SS1-7 TaxID=1328758 RepID=UPI0011663454|nr:hypothetical protein L226DRAFT_76274 [Lentinus tigrinus ALCF2SS1-7]
MRLSVAVNAPPTTDFPARALVAPRSSRPLRRVRHRSSPPRLPRPRRAQASSQLFSSNTRRSRRSRTRRSSTVPIAWTCLTHTFTYPSPSMQLYRWIWTDVTVCHYSPTHDRTMNGFWFHPCTTGRVCTHPNPL